MSKEMLLEGMFGIPEGLNANTAELVSGFATALAQKLREAELKYGYTDLWKNPNWLEECRVKLAEHIQKGDPRDVAAYCAFLWFHNAGTKMIDHVIVPKDVYVTMARDAHRWGTMQYLWFLCERIEINAEGDAPNEWQLDFDGAECMGKIWKGQDLADLVDQVSVEFEQMPKEEEA